MSWGRAYLTTVMAVMAATHLLAAQTNPDPRLAEAFALERNGQTKQSIAAVQALLEPGSLNEPDTGKAWNILALAYEDQGDFTDAQPAYERSIRALENSPNHIKDYAMALDDLGGLYLAMGQADLAVRIKEKTLQLYRKIGDHEGSAIACSDLAGLALSQRRIRNGRKYLELARREETLASALDDDNLAAISSMQGWLAQLQGDLSGSLTSYQLSLSLWQRRHGEEHASTGWGYILVGNIKAEQGQTASALADMQRGLAILDRTLGRQHPRYLQADIAYLRLLERTEAHAEAARMKTTAERELRTFYRDHCSDCTISAVAFH
jgi:tetratricopeptide (TPR) repeat protein